LTPLPDSGNVCRAEVDNVWWRTGDRHGLEFGEQIDVRDRDEVDLDVGVLLLVLLDQLLFQFVGRWVFMAQEGQGGLLCRDGTAKTATGAERESRRSRGLQQAASIDAASLPRRNPTRIHLVLLRNPAVAPTLISPTDLLPRARGFSASVPPVAVIGTEFAQRAIRVVARHNSREAGLPEDQVGRPTVALMDTRCVSLRPYTLR
jgi:hypothetical protein